MGGSNSTEKQTQNLVSKVLPGGRLPEWANPDDIKDLPSLKAKLRATGLECSSMVMAIDFTNSNRETGMHSFRGRSLHTLDTPGGNPYENVIEILGKTLADFDDDGKIPLLGFGDVRSKHHSVLKLGPASGCSGVDGVLTQYRRTLRDPDFSMSGPTSFAPAINEAVEIVKRSGGEFHILVIVGDGQICGPGCLEATKRAIVDASKHPLSIVFVGVGDGPWDQQEEFDDQLPERDFDNFQFVDFNAFQNAMAESRASRETVEAAFAVCALQELPAQYTASKALGSVYGQQRAEALGGGTEAENAMLAAAIAASLGQDTTSAAAAAGRGFSFKRSCKEASSSAASRPRLYV